MRKIILIIMCVSLLTITGICENVSAASLKKATMFDENGLRIEAKKELINIIFSKAGQNDKAEAYYLLGSIAFNEKRISVALNSWRTLIIKYPESSKAKLVKDKINELAEIVGESSEEFIKNAIAQSYMSHADFWSKRKDRIFIIDSSWIGSVDAAVKWYDKVIKEYPKTNSSERAYKGKLRTLLGWKEPGRYGSSHGIKEDFNKYIPQLLNTFASFEQDFPKAASLQAFRYQIAQVYWSKKDWKNTRVWLNKIIEIAGEKDTFYKDLSKRRLKKVEF